MRTLNLGILAHVDAGKTTLTERLLYAAGVIDEVGSVDKGSTQTDTLELERQRGITIKSAVVSFVIDDVVVNLIDTPGHPDFIAEVERVLSVLDGAVLVISAVEGVQSQTRVLMRTLQRLRIPTLIFVNKIDRGGADNEAALDAIMRRLTPAVTAMGWVRDVGTRASEFEPYGPADGNLAARTKHSLVHPVFFGSAITGAGVASLMAGITELLPAKEGDDEGAVSGTVFKIDRGRAGERIAYVRMFAGAVHVRDHLDDDRKITAIRVFDNGGAVERRTLKAGEIGQLWGLGKIQIGDAIGALPKTATQQQQFAPPTLETVVAPTQAADGGALRVALDQLAEQDPLINVRQDDTRQETWVSLYGEVQKEVIEATLANDFGIAVTFRETTAICIERPRGTDHAVELLQSDAHPFSATIGLRVEPAPVDSGIAFRLDVNPRDIPLYIFKTADDFADAMSQYVGLALAEGLAGWQVTDCIVTMTACGYYIGDGPAKPSRPTARTSARDFRKMTPMILMRALELAGTTVCEPIMRVDLEVPSDSFGAVADEVGRLGGGVEASRVRDDITTIDAVLPAARAQDLAMRLPRLTSGEGVAEMRFAGYQPARGEPPRRRRTTINPLDRTEYLRKVTTRSYGA